MHREVHSREAQLKKQPKACKGLTIKPGCCAEFRESQFTSSGKELCSFRASDQDHPLTEIIINLMNSPQLASMLCDSQLGAPSSRCLKTT
jgi:hypothetical protein